MQEIELMPDEYIIHEFRGVSIWTKDYEHCIDEMILTNQNVYYSEDEDSSAWKTNYVWKSFLLSDIKIINEQVQASYVKDDSYGEFARIQLKNKTVRFCMNKKEIATLINEILNLLGGNVTQENYVYIEPKRTSKLKKKIDDALGLVEKRDIEENPFNNKQMNYQKEDNIKTTEKLKYCTKCGNALYPDQNFCIKCGTPRVDLSKMGYTDNVVTEKNTDCAESNRDRHIRFEGDLHKCPNCGGIINAFEVKCPVCGHEFRNNESSSSTKLFAKHIQEIEASRPNRLGKRKIWEINEIDKTDQEVISLIKNFPVPNNVEDMFEFMSLALSNINYQALAGHPDYSDAEKQKSEAWLNKMSQIYTKASMMNIGEQEYIKLTQIHSAILDKKKIAEKEQIRKGRKEWRFLLRLILGSLGVIIACSILAMIHENHTASDYIEKIEQALSSSDYEDALMYTELLMCERGDETELTAKKYIKKILEQSYNDNVVIEFVPFVEEIDTETSEAKKKKNVEKYVSDTIKQFYEKNPLPHVSE